MNDGTTAAVQGALDRFYAGDPASLNDLFAAANRRMERLAHTMLLNDRIRAREDTADIVQEASVRLLRALPALRDDKERRVESSLQFFRLTACAMRRTLLDLGRHFTGTGGTGMSRENVSLASASTWHGLEPVDDASNATDELVQWCEFHERVEALPEELRDVFDLIWYDELTQEETARLLGVSIPTVKRRWRDAKLALIELLGDNFPGAI
jgi:RNA polymerase sigma-70 factor (ECF subfamily)